MRTVDDRSESVLPLSCIIGLPGDPRSRSYRPHGIIGIINLIVIHMTGEPHTPFPPFL